MIAWLSGRLIEKTLPSVIIDVQGVGYEVFMPLTMGLELPEPPTEVVLYTHQSIREDNHQLFGFVDKQSRHLFRLLIRVNGIGPKLALNILSAMPVKHFVSAIAQQQHSMLLKLPGVGKKMADRLLIEMPTLLEQLTDALPESALNTDQQDAIAALVSLGYKPKEASQAVESFAADGLDQQALIREALKKLAGVKA